jgi:hypothetical protein
MTLRNAALFALLAMALLTAMLTVNLILNLSGVMRGFIPPVTLLTSLIQWLASVGVFVFFLVFHKAQ